MLRLDIGSLGLPWLCVGGEAVGREVWQEKKWPRFPGGVKGGFWRS